MSNSNKTYRIKTDFKENRNIFVNLEQDYNTFEILSLKLDDKDNYRLHDSNYGIIVGRVIANNGFGVENAKVSIFIEADFNDKPYLRSAYPYTTTSDKNDGVRYNLLSDEQINNCHQVVGTFPSKEYLLENDVLCEVFDKYYKFTVRTNHCGDYMICGVPVGEYTLHMDLDLSDCGILSQRPRDFVYKGYTIEQFMNPNQFKTDSELGSLSQIFSQDTSVNVVPFWGNGQSSSSIGLTRADFNIAFTFEPTCVFMGCIVGDNASNGINKKCIPTENSGAMDELVTGEGTIEIIRKTIDDKVEEFQVKGNQVIDGNGVWCYQIPMNLDYVKHDEYGNIVPTNNPNQGIPTRARVRFRVSMNDFEENTDNYFRCKVLVPNNPKNTDELDYDFGTNTKESSYRDLYWNNVYTVKSYIPRFQKSKQFRDERFTGIKHCNIYGQNNPIPYNSIRIKLPLMFTLLCALIKTYIRIVYFINNTNRFFTRVMCRITKLVILPDGFRDHAQNAVDNSTLTVISDGLCPDLEGWYFAPADKIVLTDMQSRDGKRNLTELTLNKIKTGDIEGNSIDKKSIDFQDDGEEEYFCLTTNVSYLVSCIEMNLAQEYRVINFDFYNDWINGMIYMPRWMRYMRNKSSYLFGLIKTNGVIKGCVSSDSDGLGTSGNYKMLSFNNNRYYTQQCALVYGLNNNKLPNISSNNGCVKEKYVKSNVQKCHKKSGMKRIKIFNNNGGIVHYKLNKDKKYLYYFKPCEWKKESGKKVNLFATDLVLLGSLNDCSIYGLPKAFKYLSSSSFKMPTNLAMTNMEDAGYLYTKGTNTMCIDNIVLPKETLVIQESKEVKTTGDYYKELQNKEHLKIGDFYAELVEYNEEQTSGSEYEETEYKEINIYIVIALSYIKLRNYYPSSSTEVLVDEEKNIFIRWDNDNKKWYLGSNIENIDGVVLSSSTFANTIKIYGDGNHKEQQLEEGEKLYSDYDDYVAMTEAAGIAWNYNGPDQGKSEYSNENDTLYQPGGHFLGMSCTNSQTNIKSCLNLTRICEMGVTMSQRHEELRARTGDTFSYRYLVPTGVISEEDIVGSNFRTMFATMNSKRLIGDSIDSSTSYKVYSFDYLRPNVFDGLAGKFINGGSYYNKKLEDGIDFLVEDNLSGITADTKEAYDLKHYTMRRTMDSTSNTDYFMFRMGLTGLTEEEQKQKFFKVEDEEKDRYMLPQYENSFYFYFGLKSGATALDELNKEFFSECSNITSSDVVDL